MHQGTTASTSPRRSQSHGHLQGVGTDDRILAGGPLSARPRWEPGKEEAANSSGPAGGGGLQSGRRPAVAGDWNSGDGRWFGCTSTVREKRARRGGRRLARRGTGGRAAASGASRCECHGGEEDRRAAATKPDWEPGREGNRRGEEKLASGVARSRLTAALGRRPTTGGAGPVETSYDGGRPSGGEGEENGSWTRPGLLETGRRRPGDGAAVATAVQNSATTAAPFPAAGRSRRRRTGEGGGSSVEACRGEREREEPFDFYKRAEKRKGRRQRAEGKGEGT
ncbi:hypothetical protein BT93_B2754 [Corymbia citriodora subsp. variegata]|nr:hypothetical protein BT93_B2754 [Corymbia citriodora subsp. variegata]